LTKLQYDGFVGLGLGGVLGPLLSECPVYDGWRCRKGCRRSLLLRVAEGRELSKEGVTLLQVCGGFVSGWGSGSRKEVLTEGSAGASVRWWDHDGRGRWGGGVG